MRILGAKPVETLPPTLYANAADFCQIFVKDMNRLFLLSLLLTADSEQAERCFLQGFEDARHGKLVFKGWAQSWARRAIILSAIRMMRPHPHSDLHSPSSTGGRVQRLPAELAAVLRLGAFERFVFVMSVLEGYHLRECKLLLDCSTSDVAQARIRAFQQLGSRGEIENVIRLQSKVEGGEFRPSALIPRLAVPA